MHYPFGQGSIQRVALSNKTGKSQQLLLFAGCGNIYNNMYVFIIKCSFSVFKNILHESWKLFH